MLALEARAFDGRYPKIINAYWRDVFLAQQFVVAGAFDSLEFIDGRRFEPEYLTQLFGLNDDISVERDDRFFNPRFLFGDKPAPACPQE